MSDELKKNLREIKSYVVRAGRVTKKQQLALDNLSGKYLIKYEQNEFVSFYEIFKNHNPVTLEIGFGMGASLVEMAKNNYQMNYLGIEVHQAGVGNILHEIEHQNITNLRVISHDAIEVLKNMIKPNSLDGIQIYFPDPWHKKKHNKRRLVNQTSLDLFAEKLANDGVLHFASDWLEYAEDVLTLLKNHNQYENLYSGFAPRPEWRPLTKFEKRGQNLDHVISDILFKKIRGK